MSRPEFIVIGLCNTDYRIKFPPMAAHFDVFSDENIILFPKEEKIVHSNISVTECPQNIICEIKPIKEMVIKKRLDIQNYVMDEGLVKIKLKNLNGSAVDIKKGDKIAVLSFASSRKFYTK